MTGALRRRRRQQGHGDGVPRPMMPPARPDLDEQLFRPDHGPATAAHFFTVPQAGVKSVRRWFRSAVDLRARSGQGNLTDEQAKDLQGGPVGTSRHTAKGFPDWEIRGQLTGK